MKIPGYYTSGEFAKLAQVSVRTIRFYDKQNILKPSYVNDSGARFYSDEDLVRLQQIILLKYLGFSLDDIKQITINDSDYHILLNSLKQQLKFIQDKIEQLELVEKAILDTTASIEKNHNVNWRQMLDLIHLTNMEKSMKTQYQNAANLSARIRLHHLYSTNPQGWFPWIYEQCDIKENQSILEIGCGNGSLWKENKQKLPDHCHILLSDISEGMLRDARRNLGWQDQRFTYLTFDCHHIPLENDSQDLVLANHVLFYCNDIPKVFAEVHRVLRKGGIFICSSYGAAHMQEVSRLVQEFDSRITLSAEKLYEKFGLDDGELLLKPFFTDIQKIVYDDSLIVDTPEPLIEYILSCHGNQNQYIIEHYQEFRTFTTKKVGKKFKITKEAGIFICKKP